MTLSENESPELVARVHRIIASQAVTGETVGIEHYARMILLAGDTDERLAFLADAASEGRHLVAMRAMAERLGLQVEVAIDDAYWSAVRGAFRERADAGDLLGCIVIQDVVLESYAAVLYERAAPVVDERFSEAVRRIAVEERAHLAHGVGALREAFEADPGLAVAAVEFANDRVARVLAEWVRPADCTPICGTCGKVGGECAKPDLAAAGMDVTGLDTAFVDTYGRALREAGLPSASVARWLARLIF